MSRSDTRDFALPCRGFPTGRHGGFFSIDAMLACAVLLVALQCVFFAHSQALAGEISSASTESKLASLHSIADYLVRAGGACACPGAGDCIAQHCLDRPRLIGEWNENFAQRASGFDFASLELSFLPPKPQEGKLCVSRSFYSNGDAARIWVCGL